MIYRGQTWKQIHQIIIIIFDFVSINVPELSGKELCDITDCTHTHAHTYTLFRCYFMQWLMSLIQCMYAWISVFMDEDWLLPGNYMLLNHSSAPSRSVFLSVTHFVREDTSHIFSLHYFSYEFLLFWSLMMNWYFEIFTLLGFYVV